MKLTDKGIEEKALEIYQRSIKDSRIDEDICSEIYLVFIKRMKSIQRRKPKLKELGPAYVNKSLKYIVRDLRKRNKARNDREEVHDLIYQGLAGQCEAPDYEQEKDGIHKKILKFIKKSLNSCKVFKEFALWFLLFYSAYFSMDYIQKILFYLGYDFDECEADFLQLREMSLQNSARRIEDNQYRLGGIYYQIIFNHLEMKKAKTKEHYMLLNETCDGWHKKQEEILQTLAAIDITPSYKDCASLIGIDSERFRYGVKSFCNKLRQWLRQNKKNKKAA